MKGPQECYDISMKSPARKSWKQLVAFTMRIKEAHSSRTVIKDDSKRGETFGGQVMRYEMAGIIITPTPDCFIGDNPVVTLFMTSQILGLPDAMIGPVT